MITDESHYLKKKMKRRFFLRYAFVATVVIISVSLITMLAQSKANQPKTLSAKPNVILIYIDDLGYGDLGAYGSTDIPTPNIDQLAAEGVQCTASYITNPPCCPQH